MRVSNQRTETHFKEDSKMLVLSVRPGEKVHIDGPCVVMFVRCCGRGGSLGFEASREVTILRESLLEAAEAEEGDEGDV